MRHRRGSCGAASDCARCGRPVRSAPRLGAKPRRERSAPKRAALHQCHLKSSVPSALKYKRCRKVTARTEPKLYDNGLTIGESGAANEKVLTRGRGVCG